MPSTSARAFCRSLTLVRHGAVQGRPGVFRGRSDPPLSLAGWRTIRALRNHFFNPPISVVISSPRRRCREAAEWQAHQWGVPCELDEDLGELNFGLWEEMTPSEVHARWRAELEQFFAMGDEARPVGGELLGDFRSRVRRAIERALDQPSRTHTLIVAHAGVLRAAAAGLRGCSLAELHRVAWPPGAWTSVRIWRSDNAWQLLEAWNAPVPASVSLAKRARR